MTLGLINYGAAANDGTGDPLRTAFQTADAAISALNADEILLANLNQQVTNLATGNQAIANIVNSVTIGNSALSAQIAALGGIGGTKTTALPAATLPLTGAEVVEVVQSIAGVLTNVKTTCGAINPSSKPLTYVDPRDYNGWDPTGNNGISSIMQTALAAAISNNFALRIPPGLYLIDTPIDVGVAVDDGPQIIGTSPPNNLITSQFLLQPHGADVIFKSALTDKPAFYNSHRLRAAYFANFFILGPNNTTQQNSKPPNDFKQNYNPLGLRDSQFSPCCGFALDSFSGTSPPADGGYPGMSGKYTTVGGSSNIIFDNVAISQFVVDWTIGLTGSQADTLLFRNCVAMLADTGIAVGGNQSKDANWMWGSVTSCRQGFDGCNWGPGSGFPINTFGVNFGYLLRMFNYQVGDGVLQAVSNYVERVRSIGNYGTGSASFRGHTSYSGGSWTVDNVTALPPPIIFDTYGPSSFRDVNFANDGGSTVAQTVQSWNFGNDISTPIKFDCCTFGHTGIAGIPPFVGLTPANPVVSLEGCIATLGGVTQQPMSDRSTADVSAFTVSNRFAGMPRSTEYANGTGVVDFVSPTVSCVINVAATGTAYVSRAVTLTAAPGTASTSGNLTGNWTDLTGWYMTTFSNGDVRPVLYTAGHTNVSWDQWALTGTSTTSITAAGVALTFTATDVTLVQIGDQYFWKMLKQYASSTPRTVPAWIVTGIVGSVVTCQPLFDVTFYDTVANQLSAGATMQTPQVVWAPSGAALTCSMNNSTAITAVSPITVLKNGDWVNGTNLAANSRVVSGGGTASITLNKATTGGSLTAQNLWLGRFNTRTETPTW